MKTIAVPKSFFVSERDTVYSDWPSAFWREFLSNSIDAGASRILIRTRQAETGGFTIDIVDNGKGMGRDIVENVYMSLGASSKTQDSGGIGGFGRARILTCFSHENYRIRSQNLVVTGEGANYSIRETEKTLKGCAVSVAINPDYARRLHRALPKVLRSCSLRSEILLDLAPFDRDGHSLDFFKDDEMIRVDETKLKFKGWSRQGKHFRTLEDEISPWADLHVSKGEKALKGRAIIRINGMAMYEEFIASPVQIVVNLASERAREVLTASRDALRGQFRDPLMKVFTEIASEQKSAFRNKDDTPQSFIFVKKDENPGFDFPKPAMPREDTSLNTASQTETRKDRRPLENTEFSREEADIASYGMRHHLAFRVDGPTPRQKAAIARYRPEYWLTRKGEGKYAELLHAAWTGACRLSLEHLAQRHPHLIEQSPRWATGFLFSEHMEACHTQLPDIDHVYLINPIDRDGKSAFKISDPNSLNRLAALAMHEVSHTISTWHDETYAGVLTDLMGDIRGRDIEKIMQDEMQIQRDWIKTRNDILYGKNNDTLEM
jgi:hypothetical protein